MIIQPNVTTLKSVLKTYSSSGEFLHHVTVTAVPRISMILMKYIYLYTSENDNNVLILNVQHLYRPFEMLQMA